MNKRRYLVAALIVLLSCISIYTYKDLYLKDKPVMNTYKAQAGQNEPTQQTPLDTIENKVAQAIKNNDSPIVSISEPVDKHTVLVGEKVNIVARATDDNELEAMALYIRDTLKIRVNANTIAYTWDTSDLTPGDYILKVTAWDGAKSGQRSVTISIKAKPVVKDTSTKNSNSPVKTNQAYQTPVSRGVTSNSYPLFSKAQGSFGQFSYREASGGRIEVDPKWIANNIVTIKLPGLNQYVQVNKAAQDNFIMAFNYIKNGTTTINGKQVPLLSLIKSMDGTFVTRHVNWNPSGGLSNHSWGTAIDINANGHFGYINPTQEPNDPNLILWERAFKPSGFSWGNSYNDSMHFELLD